MAEEIYAQTPEGIEKAVPSQYSQPLQKDDIPYPTYGKNSGLMLINLLKDDEGNEIDFFDPVWDTFLDQLTYEETAKLCLMGYHLTAGVDSITKPETNDENGPNGFNQTYNKSNMGLFYRVENAAGHVNEDGSYTDAADPDGEKKTTGFPANGLLAATRNKELSYEVGNIIGNDGIWSGMSGLYGIGANIHRSPYLGRCAEYYSEDGTLTGLMAAYECKAIEEKGVHVYNKHCVVNDQEACRHGVGVWIPEQALREIYLRAFELPITMGGAYNTMASFARIGTQTGLRVSRARRGFPPRRMRHEGHNSHRLLYRYGRFSGFRPLFRDVLRHRDRRIGYTRRKRTMGRQTAFALQLRLRQCCSENAPGRKARALADAAFQRHERILFFHENSYRYALVADSAYFARRCVRGYIRGVSRMDGDRARKRTQRALKCLLCV